jgi:Mg2+/Co2+ transporter CorB
VSRLLGIFQIEKLKIYSINNKCELNTVNGININNGSEIMYFEMNTEMFIKMVLHVDNFSEYNKTSLYKRW